MGLLEEEQLSHQKLEGTLKRKLIFAAGVVRFVEYCWEPGICFTFILNDRTAFRNHVGRSVSVFFFFNRLCSKLIFFNFFFWLRISLLFWYHKNHHCTSSRMPWWLNFSVVSGRTGRMLGFAGSKLDMKPFLGCLGYRQGVWNLAENIRFIHKIF